MTARNLTVTASPSPRRRHVLLAALAALALACATGLAGPAQALASCPNEPLRAEARSTLLPECRAYELVSPVYTADSGLGSLHGVPPFKGAALDGEAAEFLSGGGFAGARSEYAFNWYIARREDKVGWVTSWVGVPATLGGTQLTTVLSSDLTRELMQVQFLKGERAGSPGLFLSENLASAPAFSFTEVPEYTKIPEYEHRGIEGPADETPDFSHVVIRGPNVLGVHHDKYELYELAGVGAPAPVLRTVTVDPEGHEIIGLLGRGEGPGGSVFHAISNDGREIFFTKGDSEVSYVRVNGSKTLELGGGLFQGASEDGSMVFLSGAAGELYMDELRSEPGHEEVTKTVPIAPVGPF